MDLFGLKARANARVERANAQLELTVQIEKMLNDGIISDEEYAILWDIAQKGGIRESELQTMMRESASKLLKKKIKEATHDFQITDEEYDELWKYAQSAKLTKAAFDEMIDLNRKECLLPYVRQAITTTGKLNKQQKLYIEKLGTSAKLDNKKIEQVIKQARQEYKEKQSERMRELVQTISKYTLITLAATIVIALIVIGSMAIYRSIHVPSKPKELTIAPNPMFVLEDYLCGEIYGTFEAKAMPKDGKLVITPYLEVEGGRYYGNPVTYIGERTLRHDGDVVVPYSGGKRIAQAFNIENPTYGKGMNLCLHFDASYGEKTAKMKDVCVAPVWSIESLEAEKEYRQATPELLAEIFGFLAFVLLGLIILFVCKGWFSSIFGFVTIPLMIIFFLLMYFPARKVTKIETEIHDLRKQYDNAVRVHNRQQGIQEETASFDEAAKEINTME